MHKLFDNSLAPGLQQAFSKTAGEALDAGKTDSLYLTSVAIEWVRAPK